MLKVFFSVYVNIIESYTVRLGAIILTYHVLLPKDFKTNLKYLIYYYSLRTLNDIPEYFENCL